MIREHKVLVIMTIDYDNETIKHLVDERIALEGTTLEKIQAEAAGILVESVEEMLQDGDDCPGVKFSYTVVNDEATA